MNFFRRKNPKSVIASNRDGNYKQVVALAQHKLTTNWGISVDECMQIAVNAANACAHYAKMGRLKLKSVGPIQTIVIILPGDREVTPPAVEQLLSWATPGSAIDFLASASGMAQIARKQDENPFN